MARKMTETQRKALEFMAGQPRGEACGYTLKVNKCGNTKTLGGLSLRGYVTPVGQGHMAFPANATWRITQAGRAALAEGRS